MPSPFHYEPGSRVVGEAITVRISTLEVVGITPPPLLPTAELALTDAVVPVAYDAATQEIVVDPVVPAAVGDSLRVTLRGNAGSYAQAMEITIPPAVNLVVDGSQLVGTLPPAVVPQGALA